MNAAFADVCTAPHLGQPVRMPDGSTVMNARRRMWRRLLMMHGVAVAFGVIVSASMSDPTVALAIAAFAALALPMLWFVLFKTPPRTPE